MIRRLRRRHLWMTIVLAIVVPTLLVLALLSRRPVPEPDPARESVETPRAGN